MYILNYVYIHILFFIYISHTQIRISQMNFFLLVASTEVILEERTHGPLRYNVASGKLTFGDSYHYKPDAEGLEVQMDVLGSYW